MSDDFYIGYRKTTSPKLARFVRIVVAGILLVSVAAAALIGAMQQPAGDGRYDFGGKTQLEGRVGLSPIQEAVIQSEDGQPIPERAVLIVGAGKHGLDAVRNSPGGLAKFTGARIERGGVQMIEIADPASIVETGSGTLLSDRILRSDFSAEGELIDTKCYLGVMNPAEGKVHRACASVCLRGGVPPGLLIHDASGKRHVIVLNFRGESAPTLNPEWAGRVVRISGALEDYLGLPVLNVREISLR